MMATARPEHRCILSIDQGSSSLKTAIYAVGTHCEQRLLEGGIERLGTPDAALRLRDYRGSEPRETSQALGGATPIAALLEMLHEQSVRSASGKCGRHDEESSIGVIARETYSQHRYKRFLSGSPRL